MAARGRTTMRAGSVRRIWRLPISGLLLALAACAGGGGGDGSVAGGVTYTLSGTTTTAVAGAAVASVAISITGPWLATTSTNAMGQYSVSGLAPGIYAVTATLTDFGFVPSTQQVTISGTDATGVDFLAVRGGRIAADQQILPGSFSSADQL